ncbi:MAG TPA: division/cell wall cluster transcriptional repressor MraZ [Candidatus Paceibacterota bacterium]
MLIGEYKHTLDDKKRVAIPIRFRKELGKKVVVTHGLDHCLWTYTLIEWKKVAEKLSGLSFGQADTRGFNRFMLSGAIEIDVDSLGRILIPDFLKDYAKLKERVVITGVHSRVEIWDDEGWQIYKKKIAEQADVLAEKLGEIGVI